jgi:hypothetical protein
LIIAAWRSDDGAFGDDIARVYDVDFERRGVSVILTVTDCIGFVNVISRKLQREWVPRIHRPKVVRIVYSGDPS